jgi:hypothetical protein
VWRFSTRNTGMRIPTMASEQARARHGSSPLIYDSEDRLA